jgi:hypothetical protein
MAQQVRANPGRTQAQIRSRTDQIRLGVWIELLSLFWMVIEASIAITAGFAAHSVSLEGFGIKN